MSGISRVEEEEEELNYCSLMEQEVATVITARISLEKGHSFMVSKWQYSLERLAAATAAELYLRFWHKKVAFLGL